MITVRWATVADAASLAALGFFEPSTDQFSAELAAFMREHESSHYCAVATDDSELIGMAWLAVTDRVPRPGVTRRSGDIQSVFVSLEYRRRGVATRLMRLLDERARELGLAHQTVHSSTAGLPLYANQGFLSSPQLLRKDR